MPTSPFTTVSIILETIMNLNPLPELVLDVGFGNGKYGFLCREYLTYWNSPNERRAITIHGIEAFEEYIGVIQRETYDEIFLGNAMTILPRLQDDYYDLALLIDVVEHFHFADGVELINQLTRVSKVLIVSTPQKFWPQGDSWGNSFERHLSLWNKQKLTKLGAVDIKASENWIAIYAREPYAYQFSSKYKISKYMNRHLPHGIIGLLRKIYHIGG